MPPRKPKDYKEPEPPVIYSEYKVLQNLKHRDTGEIVLRGGTVERDGFLQHMTDDDIVLHENLGTIAPLDGAKAFNAAEPVAVEPEVKEKTFGKKKAGSTTVNTWPDNDDDKEGDQ